MSLENICRIHAPSGSELRIKEYILNHVRENNNNWLVKPKVIKDRIKDNLILVFGKPYVAVFCHTDSTGFTVRYNNYIINIGSPNLKESDILRTLNDNGGDQIFNIIKEEEKQFKIDSTQILKPGTTLTFAPAFKEENNIVTAPYLDNRVGVWACLELARTLKNGMIVFTAYEEHGGGSVEFLAPLIYNEYGVSKALICDMTWQSESVVSGGGMVVSLRDKYIPRQKYTDRITEILLKNNVKFQTEVEGSGASDGGYLQKSSVPFDWCFTGIPVGEMHSSGETADLNDIDVLISSLGILCENLKT